MEGTIRPYRPTDFRAIMDIFNEIIDEGQYYYWYRPLNPIEFAEVLEDYDAIYVAASEEEIVLGFYMVHPNHLGRGSHIANARYGVSPKEHGQNMGKKLVEHSLEFLRKQGYKGLQCGCVVSESPMVKLYEDLGFIRIGATPNGFQAKDGSYEDTYLYYKAL